MNKVATGKSATNKARQRWTLIACILASSLSFIDSSVLNVALPAIRAGYEADAQQVQWVVNAYLLPLTALLLLGGALGDYFGRKRLLLGGTAIFALSSLTCALAPTLAVLLAARGAQGVGAALLLPNSLALLNAAFSGEKRGRAVGIWAAAGAASAAIAPLVGGWLVDTVGWPAIFYLNLPIALCAILIASSQVAESNERGAGRTDYLGAALATLGLGGLTYALTLWSATRHFSAQAVTALALGSLLLGGFVLTQYYRKERAMMPLSLFGGRCFSGLNLVTFLLYGAFGAAMLLIPYVLITSAAYSPLDAGLAMLPLPIVMTSLSPMMGSIAAGLGPRIPLTIGPIVVAAGMGLSALLTTKGGYWTSAFPMILVLAAGMTTAVAPLTSSVLGSVEEQHVAMASGFNSAVARGGGLIATALLGGVLSTKGGELVARFHSAMMISAGVAALAAVVALVMLGNPRMRKP